MLNYSTEYRISSAKEAVIGIALIGVITVATGVINGIATSYVISYISSFLPFIAGLSPVVIGGIIGVGLLMPIFNIYGLVEAMNGHFSEKLISTIIAHGISFGIGAGLVTLGITSPAAIGVLTPLPFILLFLALLMAPSSVIEVNSTDKHQNTSKDVKNDGAVPAF